MNRREMIQAAVAGALAGALPPVPPAPAAEYHDYQIVGEPWPTIEVKCEYSIMDRAWLIAAVCHDPPVLCTESLTEKAIVEHDMNDAMVRGCLRMKRAICYGVVKEELAQMAEGWKNSPFAINGIAGFLTTPAPPMPSE